MNEPALFANDEFQLEITPDDDGFRVPDSAILARQVRTVDHPRFGLLYVLSDVARALGKRQASYLALRGGVTRKVVVWTSGGPQPMLTATATELRSIIGRSRGHRVRDVATTLGFGDMFTPPIEAETLRIISAALRAFRPQAQRPCGPYRVDLYVHDLRVAVECDEIGHSDRDPEYELARQAYIAGALRCSFVRYDPDVADFNVGVVIASALAAGLAAPAQDQCGAA